MADPRLKLSNQLAQIPQSSEARIMNSLAQFGSNNVLTDAGKYWSADNASFEQGNPSFGQRVVRGIDPRTGIGFGPAFGAMHDAGANGLPLGETALAAAQAWPAWGALKSVVTPGVGLVKAGLKSANAWGKTALGFGASAVGGAGIDEAQASDKKDK